MWWPASLRRPNDLYARCRASRDVVRIALSALIAGLPDARSSLREWIEAATQASLPELVRRVFVVVD